MQRRQFCRMMAATALGVASSRRLLRLPPSATTSAAVYQWSAPPPMTIDPNVPYSAVIKTSLGEMTAELYPKDAPNNTVNNRVPLTRGSTPGDLPTGSSKSSWFRLATRPAHGTGGPGYRFADELSGPQTYVPAPWRWRTPPRTPRAASSSSAMGRAPSAAEELRDLRAGHGWPGRAGCDCVMPVKAAPARRDVVARRSAAHRVDHDPGRRTGRTRSVVSSPVSHATFLARQNLVYAKLRRRWRPPCLLRSRKPPSKPSVFTSGTSSRWSPTTWEYALVTPEGSVHFAPSLLELAWEAHKMPDDKNLLFKVGDVAACQIL